MRQHDQNRRFAGYTRPNLRAERQKMKKLSLMLSPNIALLADDDPAYQKAVEEAQTKFEEFLSALDHRQPGDTFAVKVPFADDYGREYMWVTVSQVDETHIDGRLDNHPAYVRAVKAGQEVRVPRDTLSDWLFVHKGRIVGGFTLSVMRNQLDTEHEN